MEDQKLPPVDKNGKIAGGLRELLLSPSTPVLLFVLVLLFHVDSCPSEPTLPFALLLTALVWNLLRCVGGIEFIAAFLLLSTIVVSTYNLKLLTTPSSQCSPIILAPSLVFSALSLLAFTFHFWLQSEKKSLL